MRHKTAHGFLGGPGILVLWLVAAPIMIPLWIIKTLCKENPFGCVRRRYVQVPNRRVSKKR